MRFYTLGFLICFLLGNFLCSSAQHPVVSVLEAMKDRDYQFEIHEVIKVPMKIKDKYDTIKLIRNFKIAKVGGYATYYELQKNPDNLFLISDGQVITTIDLDPPFSNSACLRYRGVDMFPFFLLDDGFQREVISSNEMKFFQPEARELVVRVENERLVSWGAGEVRNFRFDQIDEFLDPTLFDLDASFEKECSDYLSNIRKMNGTVKALKVE